MEALDRLSSVGNAIYDKFWGNDNVGSYANPQKVRLQITLGSRIDIYALPCNHLLLHIQTNYITKLGISNHRTKSKRSKRETLRWYKYSRTEQVGVCQRCYWEHKFKCNPF